MAEAFRIEERDDKIAVLTFDLPDKKVNTLGRKVLTELAGVVEPSRGTRPAISTTSRKVSSGRPSDPLRPDSTRGPAPCRVGPEVTTLQCRSAAVISRRRAISTAGMLV